MFTPEQLKRYLKLRGEMTQDEAFADYLQRLQPPFAAVLKEHVPAFTELKKD